MKNIFDRWKDANGRSMLSSMTGMSEAEVEAVWQRVKFLTYECNLAPTEAAQIATQERKQGQTPLWNSPPNRT